jgi:hypothetical protein
MFFYCVKFKPDSQYNIVLRTADHNLYYFDLHNTHEPCTKYNQFDFLIRYSVQELHISLLIYCQKKNDANKR